MLKKMLCAMLALVVSISSMVYASDKVTQAADETQAAEFKGFDLTFDDGAKNFGFTDISVASAASLSDGKDGNGLKAGSVSYYYNSFGTALTSGVYRYSFDIKKSSSDKLGAIIRTVGYDHGNSANGFDFERVYESLYINDKIQYYPSQNGVKTNGYRVWKFGDNKAELETDKWNHLDIFYDMDARYVYYYVNDNLLAKDKFAPDFKEFWGIVFTVEGGRCDIDNYKFEKFDYNAQKNLIGEGIKFEEELIAPLYVTFNENQFGYNYYGDSATMSMNMTNDTGNNREFQLDYEVVDDSGFIVYNKSEKLALDKGETKTHEVRLDTQKYGMFTLRVKASADGVEQKTYKTHKFALIKAPDEGVRNHTMAVHTLFANDVDQIPYISGIMGNFEKAGFSGERTGISRSGFKNWQSWDGGKIDYGTYQPEIEYKKSSKMKENMVILQGSSVVWNHIPVTDAELKDWENYANQVVNDTKDFATSYEIWNEPNASAFNRDKASIEQYTKLIKIAHEAVKKYNPTAKVLGCSLSGTSSSWIKEAISYAGEYMDGVAIHPYMWMQGPEAGGMYQQTQRIREVMDENNMQDKPIWFTEIGWYTHVGTDNVTAYTVEMFVLNEVYNKLAERIFLFRYTDDDNLPREGFGLLNSRIDFDPFMARPVFVALSAYNALMTDCEYKETIEYDEGQNIYKFKLNDGRDALVFWNKDENREVSLNLGCESVTAYDIYGNENTVYGIDNKYQFNVTGLPQYVVGNFGKTEKCDDLFAVDKNILEIVNNDKTDVNITNYTDSKLKVKINATTDLSAESEMSVGKEEKNIVINAGDISDNYAKGTVEGTGIISSSSLEDAYDDKGNGIELLFYDEDRLLYKKRLKAECVNPIHMINYIEHFSGEHWQYVIETTNNTFDTTLSGTVEIDEPLSFSKYISQRNIGAIKPKETKKTIIPVPDFVTNDDLELKGRLKMSNGYTIDMSKELSFRAIAKQNTAPKIDGVISPGEWNTSYAFEMNDKSGNYIPLKGERDGDSDLSAKIYLGFDDEKFYFAAEVTDDVQADDPDRGVWAGDSFQIATALQKSTSASYTELNIGLVNGEPKVTRSSGLVASLIANDIPCDLVINRDESKKLTTYELAIALNELYPASFKIRNFSSVTMSFLLNDKDIEGKGSTAGDDENRKGMFEYGSGIGSGKDPSKFLDFNLVR